ncbi:LCCL domain-containing protein [Qipengyuania gaetbuli]|uniref:LCCL domain-containing protein n=1 Tax=Qipengyuania gaetbuli TaxID=266952 RepID=UPI001CD4C814|nr:LCCL domain-containing protein [Qipengyuania gaetbuli]MCA0910599.1 hypothetical protein [Qipengyuania gaetbuli]
MEIKHGVMLGGAAALALMAAGTVTAQGNLPQVDVTPRDIGVCKAPTSYQGTDEVLACYCPESANDPNHSSAVWGSDIYTADSYTCKAARHAGVIGNAGGHVILQMLPGQSSYRGSTRNGEQTRSYGRYRASYRFVETAPPMQADADDPSTERLVSDLPDFDMSMIFSPKKKQSGLGSVLGAIGRRASSGTVRDAANVGAELANMPVGGTGAEDIGKCTSLPPKYRTEAFKLLSCTCDANFSVKSPIWGTGLYSGDSHVCKAALHAGAIGLEGGRVAFQTLVDQPSYTGSARNGVESMSYGETNRLGAYRFVE